MRVFSLAHKQNIGELDRGVRSLLALANIALIFAPFISGVALLTLIITAVYLSYSAYSGYCFIYDVCGLHS
jgi:hypothetical protein|tara:strand:- start:1054 stop:1266 length:213 start_codon:yes stop_codon:yes gene_type:complete